MIKGKYTVIKTGCLTCPEFLIAYKELEATAADYEKLDVQFYYIYQSLRHPEREGYVQPQNTKERLMHVTEAEERLGTKVPWIADTIDDSFRVAMKTNSNSVFVISPDSEIVYAADRMNGDGLRQALIGLVGDVEKPTSAADLNFPVMPRFPPTNITNEIRVERPQGLVILKTTPTTPEKTYYVKLRAEAEKSVLETGKGDLYLGFFPDPIHDVHWNNLTPAMKYELELPEGVTVDPATATANKGPGDSDTQPRQFKLKVDASKSPADIKLKLHYYACSPGMCEAKTHEYTIAFQDAGRNSRTYSFNRGQGAPGGVAKPSRQQFGPGRSQQGDGGRGPGAGQGGGRGPGMGQGGGGRGPGAGQGQRGQRGQGGNQAGGGGGGPRDRVRPRDTEFNEKFELGTQLPETLKVYTPERQLVQTKSLLTKKYTVIVSGCLTCPAYRNSYPEIEAVARDFAGDDVDFYFMYQTLAHPENWGFVQPTSIEERFAQVAHAKETLQTKIPWLTDPMDNQMKLHFSGTPNAQFVFDQSGKVVHRASWGRGSSLRTSLEELVGKPATTTSVQDLNLPRFDRQSKTASENLVERLSVEGVAVPLKVESVGKSNPVDALRSTDFTESNRYAKLRPEADQQLATTGTGKLYLGFRQDPILGASWNNLAEPPQYQIVSEGIQCSPATAKSPKIDQESDNEPREFLVDVKDWKPGQSITVKLQYFACNKEKGWCKAVQQEFTVWLEQDTEAGKVNGRSHFPGGSAGGQRGGGRGNGAGGQRGGGRGNGAGGQRGGGRGRQGGGQPGGGRPGGGGGPRGNGGGRS